MEQNNLCFLKYTLSDQKFWIQVRDAQRTHARQISLNITTANNSLYNTVNTVRDAQRARTHVKSRWTSTANNSLYYSSTLQYTVKTRDCCFFIKIY